MLAILSLAAIAVGCIGIRAFWLANATEVAHRIDECEWPLTDSEIYEQLTSRDLEFVEHG